MYIINVIDYSCFSISHEHPLCHYLDNQEYTLHVKRRTNIIYFASYSVALTFLSEMVKSGLCVFIAGVAILSNAPERLPEKKKPERGERERNRGHGSGGSNNPVSHGSSRQVRYKTCIVFFYLRTLSEVQKTQNFRFLHFAFFVILHVILAKCL